MKNLFGTVTIALLIAGLAVPAALGQQKTAKECRDEWRASTDANKGTQKDYVAKCRGEGTAAKPAAPAAAAPAKTARACREEWRASKDPAKGAEKDYVAKCRAGQTAAAPAAPAPAAAPPAAVPAAAPPSAAPKTARACREEWRASKDPAKGKEKDYVAKCRAGPTAAAPAAPVTPTAAPAPPAQTPPAAAAPPPAAPAHTPPAAAAPPPAPATPPPSATAPPPAPSAAPARPAPAAPAPAPTATAPTGADQYQDEAQAKAHCPADLVVWVNLNSHIYHFSGTSNYGRHFSGKGGAYMCEKDALRETFRAAENEKRP